MKHAQKHSSILLSFLALTISWNTALAQKADIEKQVKDRITEFFKNYTTTDCRLNGTCKADSIHINHDKRTLDIYANATFGYQPFTPENVTDIYRRLAQYLPSPADRYETRLHADGHRIEQLIPNALLKKDKREKDRLLPSSIKRQAGKSTPWVSRTSRPFDIKQGLQGRHLAVGQSHGRYYKNQKGAWTWQRPPLFCTTEDLFTQSFVVPYIIPMLERAGAVVYTPRERDTQPREVIVDNDHSTPGSIYHEEKSRKSPWRKSDRPGFAYRTGTTLSEGDNPFVQGTARQAPTARKKKNTHTIATWIPDIPQPGSYAVYVSYQTLPEAINDARYTVFHKGGATEFRVNQQMGGGTWVYLGTFEFDKGQNEYGFVALSNESDSQGQVSADAVRFGGGMGNIAREGIISGFPRYLEGARYTAQWSGLPYDMYAGRKGENDYADDINTRSHMANYLAGGSAYNPAAEGLGVPLEMTMGVHSDAGFTLKDSIIGTLGIYTTDFAEGKLASGMTRHTSRDLNDLVMTGLKRDLTAYIGREWGRRGMWNRNYSESRLSAIPSMILETLSHQNFTDMRAGHDPGFKFTVGRAVYKAIVRFLHTLHGTPHTIAPLPVENLAIEFADGPQPAKKRNKRLKTQTARLSWTPVEDPLEPTATPTGYVVYTRIGHGGFDNGQYTPVPSFTTPLEPGITYSFKVTAVNDGGESLDSETLAACAAPQPGAPVILIVGAFDRLSGPTTIDTEELQGFDLRSDAGVPYLYSTSFCGMQQGFEKKNAGIETEGGLGFSGNELEGMKIAGNTFDYPFIHGKAIQAAGGCSFVSCSDEAVENGRVRLEDYPMVDLIYGLEKQGGKSATNGEIYQTFAPAMRQAISRYLTQGGRLFVSGSHIGSDADPTFLAHWLKCQKDGTLDLPPVAGMRDAIYTTTASGSGLDFCIPRTLNEKTLAVQQPDKLMPLNPAFAALAYNDEGGYAAVAYAGNDYRTYALGFPFECITEENARAQLMAMIMKFLLTDK